MNYLLSALICLCACADAAEQALQRFEFSEPHMGTLFRIVLYAPDERAASSAAEAAFARIAGLDDKLTDYNDDSELMQLCARSGGEAVAVSADLFEILERSLVIGQQTRGAFDITVGPVVSLWRRARRKKALPDPQDLAAALTHMGIDSVILDAANSTARLKKPGMRLDLGGIAKGFAVDKALLILRARGITRALVAGGGDTGAGDAPPGAQGWAVEVQDLPQSTVNLAPSLITLDCEEATIQVAEQLRRPAPRKTLLLLANASVSTSGDEFQHLDLDGKRYSHVIDPKTGQALPGRRSVSVVAPDTTTSDALAKVCVLPAEEAVEAIDSMPGTAMLYRMEGPQGVYSQRSKAWETLPKKE